MSSIAGAIIVLAGALIMGLAADRMPNEPLPTLTSFGLIVLGLVVVFLRIKSSPSGR